MLRAAATTTRTGTTSITRTFPVTSRGLPAARFSTGFSPLDSSRLLPPSARKATRSQIRSASLTLRRRTWPSTRTTISPRKSIYNYALSSTTSLTTPISPTSTPIRWTPPSGRRCHSSFRVGGRWEPKSCFRRPSPRFCYAQQSWAEFACLPPLVTFVSRRSAADLGLCHNGSAPGPNLRQRPQDPSLSLRRHGHLQSHRGRLLYLEC